MQTPIVDFLKTYNERKICRFHMPGHKGRGPLGLESWDLTEVAGADALYEAEGIIARSEANATALFGSQASFYSTEGSSQCIRAMLHLIALNRKKGTAPLVLAARNVHKAFVYAAALLDLRVQWLWPDESRSVCSCPVSVGMLEKALEDMDEVPDAVYITSPDYLGHMQDIKALAEVCHRRGTLLAVDNAHGAYLHFLKDPVHPLDLGADICCDSAHKTLPALTGGAYLHISNNLPPEYAAGAKSALGLFGSTSPSYLCLASLDACNKYLSDGYRERLESFIIQLNELKASLLSAGWQVEGSDPLRLTLRAFEGCRGVELAERLREKGMECEFADRDHVVFMFTEQNSPEEIETLKKALLEISPYKYSALQLFRCRPEECMSIREAVMGKSETVKAEMALGRICASPLVSCPPAIPIVISGEKIDSNAIEVLQYYGINEIEVVR